MFKVQEVRQINFRKKKNILIKNENGDIKPVTYFICFEGRNQS